MGVRHPFRHIMSMQIFSISVRYDAKKPEGLADMGKKCNSSMLLGDLRMRQRTSC
jgi:hypothetical protein